MYMIYFKRWSKHDELIVYKMGISESKLTAQTVKTLVRPDSITPLPSFTLDTAKFTDGSVGFLITVVDLAKNSSVRTMPLKFMYSPSENIYTYVGNDDSTVSLIKDRISGKVICHVNTNLKEIVVRFCVSTYEPLGEAIIDKIAELYKN